MRRDELATTEKDAPELDARHPRGLVMWRLVGVIILLGCGGESAASTAPAPARAPAPLERAFEIGWDHVPTAPSAGALAADFEAMRIHGHALGADEDEARRVYEGSAVAFERVAAMYPDHLEARFHHACALARLERHDEAIAILSSVLAADLPTYGPRLETEPDLAGLARHERYGQLLAHREALTQRYLRALEDGVPVVWAPPSTSIGTSEDIEERTRSIQQAGVWLPREHRFVPMGPTLIRTVSAMLEGLVLSATVLDPRRRAVLSYDGLGQWTSVARLGEGALVVYDAATGRERERMTSAPPEAIGAMRVEAHATESGIAARFLPGSTRGAFDDAARPCLRISMDAVEVLIDVPPPAAPLPAGLSLTPPIP